MATTLGAQHEGQRQPEELRQPSGHGHIRALLSRVLPRRRAPPAHDKDKASDSPQAAPCPSSHTTPASLSIDAAVLVCGVVEGKSEKRTHLPLLRSLPLSVPRPQQDVLLASTSPLILLIDNFLDQATCEALIARASPNMKRSLVGDLDTAGYVSASRTSHSWACTAQSAPLMKRQMDEKIAKLLGSAEVKAAGGAPLRPAVVDGSIEVIRYQGGELFLEHYDNTAGKMARRRTATLIVYLNTVVEGGAIYFPSCRGAPRNTPQLSNLPHTVAQQHNDTSMGRPGLRIYPQMGRAILFWSCLTDGSQDKHSRHASEPVIKGEKWIVTQFLTDMV